MKGIRQGSIFFLLIVLFSFSPAVAAQLTTARHTVVIDPAHGGGDKGVKLSDKENEKDVTLKIALELQKELQAGGNIAVQLTRTSDRDMAIAERIKAVRDAGAGAFISIHINAGFGKKASGYEVYFPGFKAAATDKNGTAAILKDMAVNTYLNDSVALSKNIRINLQRVFPRKDRELRDAPMLILESLAMPAVVVEIGFATNIEDNKILMDEKGRKAIARALSTGIGEFFRGK